MGQKKEMTELKRLTIESFKQLDKSKLSIILDNVRSANNVGSIFRTADAFRVKKIYLTGICPIPPQKEIRKTALGATESVDWEYEENILSLISKLKENPKNQLLALEQVHGSIKLADFKKIKEAEYFLVIGNEVDGVSQLVIDQCNQCIEIPQAGTKHSLNVSISTGIALWELLKSEIEQ